MSTTLTEVVRAAAGESRRLACAQAMALAADSQVPPADVGAAADAAGVKITRCQLGLFGRSAPQPHQDDGISRPAQSVLDRLDTLAAAEITCAKAWALADELGVGRMAVGQALREQGVHVCACQLGCF